MRIFSGFDTRQRLAAEVFAWSVRQTSDLPCEFVSSSSVEGFTRNGVTQFTYARFLVPYLCGFEGTALFLDGCDMLCMDDLGQLEDALQGSTVAVVAHPANPEYGRSRSDSSFMLMDCAHLKCWTPHYVQSASDAALLRLQSLTEREIRILPKEWNTLVLPGHEPPVGTKVAHWSALSNPDGGCWIQRSGSAVWAAARDGYLDYGG